MLDEDRRQELVARLEGLGETSEEEVPNTDEGGEEPGTSDSNDRNDAEPVAAGAESTDAEANDSGQGRQSGAQRRISELVKQRNEATDNFRGLQERFSALEAQLQQMQSAASQEPPPPQQQYYDEYGNRADPAEMSPDLANLRAEFDQYRNEQVLNEVKNQLEAEIQEAIQGHPHVNGDWLRSQLIDAVRLNGSADVAEVAEYYSAFVRELQEGAVQQHQQEASNRTPREAPPRIASRGTASGNQSQQGDKPFTRDDARRNAYAILRGSQ